MLLACNHCNYLFESDKLVDQCPDCGKFAVREANEIESEEFSSRVSEWEDGGDLIERKPI